MKHVFLLIYTLMITTACESVELIPAASSDLMSQVRSHKGEKAVLLNVWALWCIPCVEEFPMIVDLDKEMSELEVIFISADFDDQLEEVKSFLNRQGVDHISYIKQEGDESFIQGIYPQWSGSLPFTVVYSRESGTIVDSWEGKESESRFRMAINIALNS